MLLLFCRPYGAVGCCGCCDCCGCCGRCDCCDCCDCFVCRGSAALHRLPVVVAPLRGCGLLRLLRSLRLLRLFCLQGFRCASPPACGRCAPTGLWVVAVVAVVAIVAVVLFAGVPLRFTACLWSLRPYGAVGCCGCCGCCAPTGLSNIC